VMLRKYQFNLFLRVPIQRISITLFSIFTDLHLILYFKFYVSDLIRWMQSHAKHILDKRCISKIIYIVHTFCENLRTLVWIQLESPSPLKNWIFEPEFSRYTVKKNIECNWIFNFFYYDWKMVSIASEWTNIFGISMS
jgi:hypothetical protein